MPRYRVLSGVVQDKRGKLVSRSDDGDAAGLQCANTFVSGDVFDIPVELKNSGGQLEEVEGSQ
jgi:hypothetical protein